MQRLMSEIWEASPGCRAIYGWPVRYSSYVMQQATEECSPLQICKMVLYFFGGGGGDPVLLIHVCRCMAVCLSQDEASCCTLELWQMASSSEGPLFLGSTDASLTAERPEGLQLQHGLCLVATRCACTASAQPGANSEGWCSTMPNNNCTRHGLTMASGHSRNTMLMVASGIYGTGAERPCISAVRYSLGNEQHAQSMEHVATPRLTHCLLALGAEHLFAAGACAFITAVWPLSMEFHHSIVRHSLRRLIYIGSVT